MSKYIPFAHVVHNVILVKGIVIESELVKGIDAIESIELLVVRVPVGVPWPSKVTVDVGPTATANAPAEGQSMAVSLGHDSIAELRLRHGELLVGALL